MSLLNDVIAPFEATAFYRGAFVDISQEDIKDKWGIFFFYPADFSFVCPTELEDLADLYDEFQKLGVEIYAVSTDTHFTHKAWHDASDKIKKVNFYMVSDSSGILSRNFDVMIENQGLAERGTFVFNPKGEIKYIELNDGAIGRDASELLKRVQALQYVAKNPKQVCPAKWKKGQEAIKPSLDLVGKL